MGHKGGGYLSIRHGEIFKFSSAQDCNNCESWWGKKLNNINCKRVFYVLFLDTLNPDQQMALTWLGHEPRTVDRKGAAVAENARIALL